MGDALIVTTIPEECLMVPMMRDEKGTEIPLSKHYGRRWIGPEKWKLLAAHSGAFYRLEIPAADVWMPPHEADADPSAFSRSHRSAMKQSLQTFLNERLGRLAGMLRTGRWLLGHVSVRVAKIEELKRDALDFSRTSGLRQRKPEAQK